MKQRNILTPAETKCNVTDPSLAFSLTCIGCDASEDSAEAALVGGWKQIRPDDGPSWNYLGVCPDCVRKEDYR